MAAEIAEVGAVARRQLTANARRRPSWRRNKRANRRSRSRSPAAAPIMRPSISSIWSSSRPRSPALARAIARLALPCAAAARRRRRDRHFAVGPKPRYRRHAAGGERPGRGGDCDGQRRGLSARARRRRPLAVACRRRALGGGDQVDDRLAGGGRLSRGPLERGRELLAALAKLPSVLDLSSAAGPSAAVETLAKASSLFVVGRGATHAIAAEAALKLKETSAIHAEAFSSAEVLRGPAELAWISVLAFAPADAARQDFSTR